MSDSSKNADVETEYSTKKTALVPKSSSDTIYSSLSEIGVQGASIYAFLRFPQVWKAFMEWRHKDEDNMNILQLRENQKFDELVSEIMSRKTIADDIKLYNFLLRKYSDSGARKTMTRIKAVVEQFKEDYREANNAKKKEGR